MNPEEIEGAVAFPSLLCTEVLGDDDEEDGENRPPPPPPLDGVEDDEETRYVDDGETRNGEAVANDDGAVRTTSPGREILAPIEGLPKGVFQGLTVMEVDVQDPTAYVDPVLANIEEHGGFQNLISQHRIMVKECDRFYILFPDHQAPRNPLSDLCNGLVVSRDKKKIVARGIDRMFKTEDPRHTYFESFDTKIVPKLDGILIRFFYFADLWHICHENVGDANVLLTDGTFSENLITVSDLIVKIKEISPDYLNFCMMCDHHLNRDNTYLCELLTSRLRNVKNYDADALVLLGIRRNADGEWLDGSEVEKQFFDMRPPFAEERLCDVDIESFPMDFPGYVVYDGSRPFAVLENKRFKKLSAMRHSRGTAVNAKIEQVLCSDATYLKLFPTDRPVFERIEDSYKAVVTYLARKFEERKNAVPSEFEKKNRGKCWLDVVEKKYATYMAARKQGQVKYEQSHFTKSDFDALSTKFKVRLIKNMLNLKLELCIGISGSGKRSFGRGLQQSGYVHINEDDIYRLMFCGELTSKMVISKEARRKRVLMECIRIWNDSVFCLRNVVITNNNLDKNERIGWERRAEVCSYSVHRKFFDEKIELAMDRNCTKGFASVCHKNFFEQVEKYKQVSLELGHWTPYEPNLSLPKAVIVEFEDCIAVGYDGVCVSSLYPSPFVIRMLNALHEASPEISFIVMSDLHQTIIEYVRHFLTAHTNWYPVNIFMQSHKNPNRPDDFFDSVFDTNLKDLYNVCQVFSGKKSRVRYWISKGLQVIDVSYKYW